MQPLLWMRGFRLAIVGLALIGVGAAWLWQIPWLLAVSLVIAAEETLESSIAIVALSSDQAQDVAQRRSETQTGNGAEQASSASS